MKKQVTDLCERYYKLIDGYYGLMDTATVQKDESFRKHLLNVFHAIDKVEIYITENYIWD